MIRWCFRHQSILCFAIICRLKYTPGLGGRALCPLYGHSPVFRVFRVWQSWPMWRTVLLPCSIVDDWPLATSHDARRLISLYNHNTVCFYFQRNKFPSCLTKPMRLKIEVLIQTCQQILNIRHIREERSNLWCITKWMPYNLSFRVPTKLYMQPTEKTLSNDDTNLFPMFLQFCSLTFISLVQINPNWDY